MTRQYDAWIGKKTTTTALVTAYQADSLMATLDRDHVPFKDGDEIPPGWHLFYIREVVKLSDTAEDGHPKRGSFLPHSSGEEAAPTAAGGSRRGGLGRKGLCTRLLASSCSLSALNYSSSSLAR